MIANYDLAAGSCGGWDPKLNAWPAKVGEVIDIILINEPEGVVGGFDVHPWHIHGEHVYDLGSGNGKYDAAANKKRIADYKPVLRDSTYLYRFTPGDGLNLPPYSQQGWRAWRLRVQDVGQEESLTRLRCDTLTLLFSVWSALP